MQNEQSLFCYCDFYKQQLPTAKSTYSLPTAKPTYSLSTVKLTYPLSTVKEVNMRCNPMNVQNECPNCGRNRDLFSKGRKDKKFCSDACKSQYHSKNAIRVSVQDIVELIKKFPGTKGILGKYIRKLSIRIIGQK